MGNSFREGVHWQNCVFGIFSESSHDVCSVSGVSMNPVGWAPDIFHKTRGEGFRAAGSTFLFHYFQSAILMGQIPSGPSDTLVFVC